VWGALAETLSARVSDLVGWHSWPLEFPAAALARASQPTMAAMSARETGQQQDDEIDRLFVQPSG
jgi:hypothetical protein